MSSRPVKPRARRIALIVASVPELHIRTDSIDGTMAQMRSAISVSSSVGAPNDSPFSAATCTAAMTSGWACPSTIGPQEPT